VLARARSGILDGEAAADVLPRHVAWCGDVIINYLVSEASKAGVRLRAEFIRTDRNRMMYITYRFSNFREIDEVDGVSLLENDCSVVSNYPSYASVCIVNGIGSRQSEAA